MFYKETNFKETPTGRIPQDWDVGEVEDLGEVVTGTTPSTFIKQYWNGEYPFVTPTDMTESKYVEVTERRVTKKGLQRGRLIPTDSVLVTCIASIGKIALAFGPCITNQQINAVICKQEVNPHYVYYAMVSRSNILRAWAGRTTNPIVKKSLFEKFPLALPKTVNEQRKIAEVLSIVDEAIQKTSEVIAKTERLKQGLMQELLTKGIGHREFRDTEIGRVPKEWAVVKLADKSVSEIIMGQSPPSSTYNKRNTGLPFLQGKKEFGEVYPSPTTYCSKPIRIAEANDILLSVRAPVGDVNIAPFRCCIGRGLTAIRAKSGKLNYVYLFNCLKFSSGKFQALSAGSTFKAIRRQEIENHLIPLPSLSEQQRIASILSTVDKKLELERNEKAKLERIKQGLMALLLTGRIRIRVN